MANRGRPYLFYNTATSICSRLFYCDDLERTRWTRGGASGRLGAVSEFESLSPQLEGSVGRGVALGLLLHLLQFLVVPGIKFLFSVFYPQDQLPLAAGLLFCSFAWSVTQFLYLGPAVWLAYRKSQRETGKGILIVAAVGVLINGACDAFFLRPARWVTLVETDWFLTRTYRNGEQFKLLSIWTEEAYQDGLRPTLTLFLRPKPFETTKPRYKRGDRQ
jgi:hypothetical protein